MHKIKIKKRKDGRFQFRVGRKWFCGVLSDHYVHVYRGMAPKFPAYGHRIPQYNMSSLCNRHMVETVINNNVGLLFDPFAWNNKFSQDETQLLLPIPRNHA